MHMVFLFICLFVFVFVFGDRLSLCSSGCPGTHYVDKADLELRNSPASASQVLGLKMCASTPNRIDHLLSERALEIHHFLSLLVLLNSSR